MLFGKGKGEDPLVLLQQGKYKEAAKVLELRLQRSPHDLSMKMRLAEAYEGAGRKDDAAAIYVAEADADLAGGARSQALGLLKKASRLLPGDEDLKARILKLEGQPDASADQSFSFDVDMSSSDEAAEPVSSGSEEEPVVEVEVEADSAETEAGEAIGLGPAQALDAVAPTGEETIGLGPAEDGPVEAIVEIEAGDLEAAPEEPVIEAVELPTVEAEMLEVDASALTVEPALEPEQAIEAQPEQVVQTEEPGPEPPRALLTRLFPELDPSHLDLLESASREGWVNAGKVLIREEEAGDSMFVVTSGRLEARGHFDGRELLLATFGPGDIIGEVAFLNRVPRTATVTAVEDSTYVELPGDEVRAQLAEVPETLALLESLLEQRVEKTLQLLKKTDRQHDGDT
jgi:CRP/FNR family transcriptional regulator, cyclic AMP receptor protein